MNKIGITAYVSGKVQGVGFRFFTQRKAIELNLTGHVRNLNNGQVKIVAYGAREKIEQLLTWIYNGGVPGANVDNVVTELCDLIQLKGFDIQY